MPPRSPAAATTSTARSPTLARGVGELQRRAGLPRRRDRARPHRCALADACCRSAGPSPAGGARGRARCSTTRRWTSCCKRLVHVGSAAADDGAGAPAGARDHRVELRLGPARDLLRRAADIEPWTRSQRIAVRERIGVPHLMASSAIPFVFPAVSLDLRGQQRILRRRLDAPVGADLAGRAPRCAAHPRDRCRTHARAARTARRERRIPEPGPDRGTRAVEHLPRRAGGRRRAAEAHQRDAGAAAGIGARSDQPAADRGAGDRAQPATGRHRGPALCTTCPPPCARCCALSAYRARARMRAAGRWPATCCSRRRTRAN